jgi:hypothetical protein
MGVHLSFSSFLQECSEDIYDGAYANAQDQYVNQPLQFGHQVRHGIPYNFLLVDKQPHCGCTGSTWTVCQPRVGQHFAKCPTYQASMW